MCGFVRCKGDPPTFDSAWPKALLVTMTYADGMEPEYHVKQWVGGGAQLTNDKATRSRSPGMVRHLAEISMPRLSATRTL